MADMKDNISVSLEKDIIAWADNQVNSGKYRNRSHVIEFALNQLRKQEA